MSQIIVLQPDIHLDIPTVRGINTVRHKMKALLRRVVCISLVTVAVLAADPKPDPYPVYPGSKFTGFGKKKDGAICVQVSGDVMHPGTYYLSKNAGLYSLIKMMGLSAGLGVNGLNPLDVTLSYAGPNGEESQRTIRFAGYTDYDMERFSLAGVTSCVVVPRHYDKEPNKAAEPTRTTVTPPAGAGDRASGARGSP